MIAEARRQATGNRKQKTQDNNQDAKSEPWFWLSPVACLLAPVMLALAIFAHGCHSGDHDDEPLFAPPSQQPESPR